MKVYVLSAYYAHSREFDVVGVYDRPKTARKAVDKRVMHVTKNRWKKTADTRYYAYSGVTYSVSEYKVIKEKFDA